MKRLTLRETMEHLLAGGEIIASNSGYNPFRWDEEIGVVDCDGHLRTLGGHYFTKAPTKKTYSYWVNVYPDEAYTYITKEYADKDARSDRIKCEHITGTYEEKEE